MSHNEANLAIKNNTKLVLEEIKKFKKLEENGRF